MSDWRTPLVQALCQKMLSEDDYEGLPILADALEEAGCPDAQFLALLREGPRDFVNGRNRLLVNIALSEESAEAVQWFTDFAADYGEGGTREEIVQAGIDWLDGNGSTMIGGRHSDGFGICNAWEDDVEEAYWKHWSVIMGRRAPTADRDPFHCCGDWNARGTEDCAC